MTYNDRTEREGKELEGVLSSRFKGVVHQRQMSYFLFSRRLKESPAESLVERSEISMNSRLYRMHNSRIFN